MRSEVLIDPFFQDAPWEIIYDNAGQQIGEVYVLREWMRSKKARGAKKRGNKTRRNRKGH